MKRNDVFLSSAKACLENGERLMEDIEALDLESRPSTIVALAISAQEEFAKGFLLILVYRHIVPWTALIRRAVNDHVCKQLLGVVMDYLSHNWDRILASMDKPLSERYKPWPLPRSVADAINLLRHERLAQLQKRWPIGWVEVPKYDKVAMKVFNREVERLRQDALYVTIDSAGRATKLPMSIPRDTARWAIHRADRLKEVLGDHLHNEPHGVDVAGLTDLLTAIFRDLEEKQSRSVCPSSIWPRPCRHQ